MLIAIVNQYPDGHHHSVASPRRCDIVAITAVAAMKLTSLALLPTLCAAQCGPNGNAPYAAGTTTCASQGTGTNTGGGTGTSATVCASDGSDHSYAETTNSKARFITTNHCPVRGRLDRTNRDEA